MPTKPTDVRERAPTDEHELLVDRTWVYRTTRIATRLAFLPFFPERVEGRENVPDRGGLMLASNHQSFLDIPLLSHAAKHRHVSFVARDTLQKSRFLKFIMDGCGAIYVQRGKGDRAALRTMARKLELGDVVAIFPEGKRTPDGRVHEFLGGALLAARMARVPIVPAVIDGSYQAWPRERKLPRPHRLTVRFLPAVDSSRDDALELVRAAIVAALPDAK